MKFSKPINREVEIDGQDFIVSFDDFTITQLVAGPGQTTLPLYIWAMIRRPMTPEINAISTILLGVSVLFILVSFGIAQRRK